MAIEEHSVAHHGAPIMTEADVRLCQAMSLWIQTARGSKAFSYGPEWVPSYADIIKSRLFWRIRSGKPPLPHPPPTSFSCPWYEVIEELRPHYCFEARPAAVLGERRASVCQDGYDIIAERPDGSYTLGYGPYRFRLWREEAKWRAEHADIVARWPDKYPSATDAWLIQREPDLESKPSQGR